MRSLPEDASRKSSASRRSVLTINLGSDPAGISSAIARAFRNEPEWRVRSFCTKRNYIAYAEPEPWDTKTVREAWREADVVHLHHGFLSADRIVRGGFLGGGMRHKPYLLEFHGTGFRENVRAYLNELTDRKAFGVVSTLDLHVASGLAWLPSPVDVEAMSEMKQPATDKVLIAHAPTNRAIKSTALFIEAVDRLKAEGYPVEVDIIEHVPWTECLERKAKADIFYDQVLLGYGNNALEAWGMGIPVVAGADDATLDEMERRFGHLPFYHATEDTIYDALKELVESPELRQQYGDIGYQYVRQYHDYPVVVLQLKRLYERAVNIAESRAA